MLGPHGFCQNPLNHNHNLTKHNQSWVKHGNKCNYPSTVHHNQELTVSNITAVVFHQYQCNFTIGALNEVRTKPGRGGCMGSYLITRLPTLLTENSLDISRTNMQAKHSLHVIYVEQEWIAINIDHPPREVTPNQLRELAQHNLSGSVFDRPLVTEPSGVPQAYPWNPQGELSVFPMVGGCELFSLPGS